MQGTWKHHLSGYDRKGLRRRKQTRHHTLKDKLRALSRLDRMDSQKVEGIFRKEGEVINTCFEEVERQFLVSTCVVRNNHYNGWEDYYDKASKAKEAYKWKGNWFDPYSGEPLDGVVDILHTIETEFVDWDSDVPKTKTRRCWSRADDSKGKTFVYGKPLPEDWWNIYGGMWSTRRRKYCQSFANRRGRRVTRDWISKADFETEIPTYIDEKSISWCVW